MRKLALLMVCVTGLVLSGCRARYTTPGGPADFHALGITPDHAEALTDGAIRERMSGQPAARFPASVAVVRVQDERYHSYSLHRRDVVQARDFSVITSRDAESSVDMATLRALPGGRDIARLNRMLIPAGMGDTAGLRASAAELQADILFIYTFDTRFGSETKVPLLGTITLGIFPAEQARVSTTCSGAFIDTRTGFVYGVVEASESTDQLANFWTTTDAIDQSRRRAESRAFKGMVDQAIESWKGIVETYGMMRM